MAQQYIPMRLLRFLFSRLFICLFVIAALVAAIIFLCVYIHSLLPAAAALGLAYFMSAAAALALFCKHSPAEFKCAWLTLIVAFPIGGAALYFLSYISRVQRSEAPLLFPPAGCDRYEYFSCGSDFLRALTQLISAAKLRIYLEFYIIASGKVWKEVCKGLTAAVARGVEIKIIYDGFGSALRVPKADFKKLKRAGVKIKVFNRLLPVPASRLNNRDHRKIAVVDGAVMTGGVNIADEYAHIVSPYGYWKDGGALFTGQIADVYAGIFTAAFNGTAPKADYRTENAPLRFIPVADEPELCDGAMEQSLAAAIYGAKRRVYIFTPYLCGGDKLCGALKYAAANGADVKIIIPAVPDKKLTYAISRTFGENLLNDGIEIYMYTPGFMHFKGGVIDDNAYLGSYNFDFRSMRLNRENGVWGGKRLSDDVAADFKNCLALSAPLEKRPHSPAARLWRSLLCLFAPLV